MKVGLSISSPKKEYEKIWVNNKAQELHENNQKKMDHRVSQILTDKII